jgi:hypothetical protein
MNDHYLHKTEDIHSRIGVKLTHSLILVTETEEIGHNTLEAIHLHETKIKDIQGTVLSMEGALNKSKDFLNTFAKRIVSDRFNQALCFMNIMLIVSVVIVAVYKNDGKHLRGSH